MGQFKILGYIIQRNLQNDHQINKTISNINNRPLNIKKLGNKSTLKTRKILVKSIVIGKLNYGLPLLSNSTQAQLQKLNTLIIKSCQTILGNPCLRWCSNRLLNKCQLTKIWHTILELGLVYIHKIKLNQTPTSIYEMYTNPSSDIMCHIVVS